MLDPDIHQRENDHRWMRRALLEAETAARSGEIPVGAVLVADGELLAAGGNGPIGRQDPTAHAEIVALRLAAARRRNYRLPDTTLYVTLEPCIMCMGAMIHARIKRLVFGATDPKTGAAGSVYSIGGDGALNHRIELCGGVMAEECGLLLRDFFRRRRNGG